jgi:hypothetical protein
LATGGGFGGRELYSDHDEAIFDATRPLVLNAIPDLGTARPDFLDRALIVEFLDIKPEMRRDEGRFWREFEGARPRILGALLDAVVAGLGCLPAVSLDKLPRMADFAIWVNACEESLGMGRGEAQATYHSNRADAHILALESSPLYEPIAELARKGFSGTVAELLVRLNCMTNEAMRRSVRWPKAPNSLSAALRRMTSNLRSAGIEIRFSRTDFRGRHVVSLVCASEPAKKIVRDRQ